MENRTLRFVYADDEEGYHQFVELYLKKAFGEDRVQLTSVPNGRDLVSYVLANPTVDILTDVDMPIMNGLEALANLRQRGYTRKAVVMTGNPSQERTAQINLLDGRLLSKPFTMNEFVAKVRETWPEYYAREAA